MTRTMAAIALAILMVSLWHGVGGWLLAGDVAVEPAASRPSSGEPSTTAPSEATDYALAQRLVGHAGSVHDHVCTITIPRDDLYVTVEQMEVPTAAGIESRIDFYRCSCGLMSVIGQFVVTDYEANDVIDALRAKQITVASLAPFLLNEHPRLQVIRFKGEGKTDDLASAMKQALSWMGKEREVRDRSDQAVPALGK